MNTFTLIDDIINSGIKLKLDSGKLKIIAPPNKLTPDLMQQIKSRKNEIIELLSGIDKSTAVTPVEKKEYYHASSAQKRLYIIQQMNMEITAYNMPQVIPFEERIQQGKVEDIFMRLIARHESLQTAFIMVNEEIVQEINEKAVLKIERFQNQDESLTDSRADEIKRNFIRFFDLSEAPLLRMGVIKTNEGKYTFLLDMHHIISDGISQGILINEFLALYEGEELLPLRIQYKDFSQWQNGETEKEKIKQQERYWLKEFAGEIPVLELPTDYPRPVEQSFEGNSLNSHITAEDTHGLNILALKENSTLFIVMAAIFNILISKLSGQEDIVIGTLTAGRRHADLEKIIGMFLHFLSLRNSPIGDLTFREFLGDVKEKTLKAFENQDYPFEELVDKLPLERDMGRNPLFDVMFILHNMNAVSTGQDEDTEIDNSPVLQQDSHNEYESIFQTAKLDLRVTAEKRGRLLFFAFEYCTKLFKKETIERYISYFKKIISITVKEPGIRISEIEFISGEEKNRLLYDFNDTGADYPKDKTTHRLFEEQVERTPDHMALVGPGEGEKGRRGEGKKEEIQLSYGLLNEESNCLTITLLEKGVGLDNAVGIMVQRSVEMIIGILGILKAGGAYLPIDPDYPEERKRYILKDSGAEVLLALPGVQVIEKDILYFPGNGPSTLTSTSACRVSPANLAYIIYTSGSTGNPKGAAIEHFSLVNRLNWMQKKYPINTNDTILQKTTYTFDVSVWEILWWSVVGAKVHLLRHGGEKEPEIITSAVERSHVSVMHFVPSMLSVFLDYIDENGYAKRLSSLKQVIASGEALTLPLVERFNDVLCGKNGTALANLYGPTEATIDVSYFDCREVKEMEIIPIGKPIDNICLYILDKYFHIQPIGVSGELCISGTGLARGYLNRQELTAERFVFYHQRHEGHKGGRRVNMSYVYRTGDLARWHPDGNIEFLGRIDHQVKIRGFRVELGEIENRLLKISGIKEAVVLAGAESPGDKYICAYIVSDSEYEISGVREFLSEKLPNYMIPSYFIRLEKIPLTPNGKLDKKALPHPRLEAGQDYSAPQNERENKLVEMWAEVLGIEKDIIGTQANFFYLGGHSLRAIRLAAMIHKELNAKVTLPELFKMPTVKTLSRHLEGQCEEKFTVMEAAEKKAYYPVSSAQKRLFILNIIEGKNSINYNLNYVISIRGELQPRKLEAVFKELVKRHESLRTSFVLLDDRPVQIVHDNLEFSIQYIECHEKEARERINHFTKPFDLSQGPLIRVLIIKPAENHYVLAVDMHHIISDGRSMEILVNEFICLYSGETLSSLKIQYKDYSQWGVLQSEFGNLKDREQYWLNIFNGALPVLTLPTDYPRPSRRSLQGKILPFELDNQLTNKIKDLNLETETTIYMVLLAAFNILLARYSLQEEIIVGTPAAGRNHADLQDVIGSFANMLAMKNFPNENKIFVGFLKEVKETALQAYENQDFPFEDLVEKLGIKVDPSRNPIFDVVLNLVDLQEQEPIQNENHQKQNDQMVIEPYKFEHISTKYDLLLRGFPKGDHILMSLEYSTALFKESTAKNIIEDYTRILNQVVQNKELKLEDIILSDRLLLVKNTGKEVDMEFNF